MKLYTIGFTQKTAQQFFDLLKKNNVNCLVDIRLKPSGQLAAFTKKEDLRYFLKELINCDYIHLPILAPTNEILTTYRKDKNWIKYEKAFVNLLIERNVHETLDKDFFKKNTCCLLCSEPTAEHCHRRLVSEYLENNWNDVEIIHL